MRRSRFLGAVARLINLGNARGTLTVGSSGGSLGSFSGGLSGGLSQVISEGIPRVILGRFMLDRPPQVAFRQYEMSIKYFSERLGIRRGG